jgi:LuxR family maltose regulon positive regulatory protein
MRGSELWAHYGIGHGLYAMNDMDEAAEHFWVVLDAAREGQFEAVMMSAFPLVKIHIERGELDLADDVVARARSLAEYAGGSTLAEEVDALALFPALARGNKPAARQWLETSSLGKVAIRPYRKTLIRAQICLAAGIDENVRIMIEELRHALRLAAAQWQVQVQIEGDLLLARMLWQRGSGQAALDVLEEAVVLASPRGYLRRFVEGGADVGAMLHELARLRRHAEDAREILTRVAEAARRRLPAAALADPLTGRELEVLGLLAQGLPYKEIGARLNISPITVRNHAARIYDKLDAKGRRQAVEIARALRLI